MFAYSESDENQIAFSRLGKKAVEGQMLTEEERAEIARLATLIEAPRADEEDCYYICDSGFACNPDQQFPNCNCHKVCI